MSETAEFIWCFDIVAVTIQPKLWTFLGAQCGLVVVENLKALVPCYQMWCSATPSGVPQVQRNTAGCKYSLRFSIGLMPRSR